MIRKAIIVLLTLATVLLFLETVCIPELYPLFDPVPTESDRRGWLVQAGKVWLWYATQVPAASTPPPFRWEVAGFGMIRYYRVWYLKYSVIVVHVPAWLVLDILAAYPTIAFIRGPVRHWRRHRKGLCHECGYDLTGNVSGVCPECGTGIGRTGPGDSAAGLDGKPL